MPLQSRASCQRNHALPAELNALGNGPGLTAQAHLAGVAFKSVKIRPVVSGKGFKAVEAASSLKGLSIELERSRRGKATGAAAG